MATTAFPMQERECVNIEHYWNLTYVALTM